MPPATTPRGDQIVPVRQFLEQIANSSNLAELANVDLSAALAALDGCKEAHWKEIPPEVISPQIDGLLGMVLVRKRRQLAYSIKLSNLTRDPFHAIAAIAVSAGAGNALPALAAAPPPTFPSFVIGIALVWLRAFAQPIGFGEAALLHYISQKTAIDGKISIADIENVGGILVDFYGYMKGGNNNEVAALLSSLLAWKSVEEFDGGYRALESVPFGLGRIEYLSKYAR
jgi:hypothetical protein